MSIKIRPYNLGSKGAQALQDALTELVGRQVWMTKRDAALARHKVINWGSTEPCRGVKVLNSPDEVAVCINKLHYMQALTPQLENLIPLWATSKATAEKWIREGFKVYCRTLLSSKEGKGIVVASTVDELVNAPLYTCQFKHAREYRVHIVNGKVIKLVQKRKRNGSNANPLIRSNNDWVFSVNLGGTEREHVVVRETSLRVFSALGIDFGALDVLYSVKQNRAIVLECNTAPGVDNATAKVYAEAFLKEFR